jgi:hypothetical protein
MNYLRLGGRETELRGDGGPVRCEQLRRVCLGILPVQIIRYPMSLLQILEDVRRRNAAEQYYSWTQSEEGKAAARELDRLRAECAAAEANYVALCARYDAERAAAEVME